MATTRNTGSGLVLAFLIGWAMHVSPARAAAAGDFDYYVLSLSWSPTYCLIEDDGRSSLQCRRERPFAFVLHGLWPQYERGFPADCQTQTPRLSRAQIDAMLDIMPAPGLVGHQWRKHGACSGLPADAYWAKARAAYRLITIPQAYRGLTHHLTTDARAIERAFIAANSGLKPDMVTVTCSGQHVREVRVCLTKDLKLRGCSRDVSRDCARPNLVMPPVR